MQITLVRHGKTQSNFAHRYQGRLDDPLCPQGIEELMQKKQNGLYPAADFVVCSPKKRCIQTAEIVCEQYEQLKQSGCVLIEDDLRETDFGDFEGKTHEELLCSPDYLQWLATEGEGVIPNGESKDQMRARSVPAFCRCIKKAIAEHKTAPMFVIHGGTMMAILSQFDSEGRSFYDFHVANGEGFRLMIPEDGWNPDARYPIYRLDGKIG